MRRESHVRFCEGLGGRFPRATRLVIVLHEGLRPPGGRYGDIVGGHEGESRIQPRWTWSRLDGAAAMLRRR